jgi:hypothetical protein
VEVLEDNPVPVRSRGRIYRDGLVEVLREKPVPVRSTGEVILGWDSGSTER